MYKIENHDEIYVSYRPYSWSNKMRIEIFKSEKELISFLARGYLDTYKRYLNFDVSPVLYDNNYRFEYEYYDGFGRRIEPRIYKIDAWIYFCEHLKKNINKNKERNWKKYAKNKPYNGEFRKNPVYRTGKRKCIGSHAKNPRTKRIIMMYSNPEYKGFNRGCKPDYPYFAYWEHPYRNTQRNWKSQRKHQWKETA